MKMVSIDEAMELTGHTKKRSFQGWVARYNAKYRQNVILRRRGKIDVETLREAIFRISAPGEFAQKDEQSV